jgi:dTDP-glucose 4,6-dehydratase
LEGKNIPIYGDGNHIREWIYVDDTIKAILSAIEKKEFSGHLNIGSGERVSNIELVNKICSILEEKYPQKNIRYLELIKFTKDRPGHDKRYAINSDKARLEINWSSTIDINKGLRKTIEWYLENKNWWTEIRSSIYDGSRIGLIK